MENVIDEITKAHQDFTARYLLFVDDVFPQKLTWVESFIESWQREGLRIPWMCILNPNSYQKDRYTYFKNLRDAGCNVISFGAQSAIPEILKNVHRRPDEAHQLYEAVRTATRLGIATVVTYIFGLPGESEENAEATIHQMLTLRPYLMDAHVLDVLPESEIAERFPSGSVTALSQRRLEQIRKKAFRRFYLNPRTLMRLLWLVTTRNPNWLLLFPFRPVWAAVKRNKKASVDQSASS